MPHDPLPTRPGAARTAGVIAGLAILAIASGYPTARAADPIRCEGTVGYRIGHGAVTTAQARPAQSDAYLYVPLYLPTANAHWPGNLKKYRLCTDNTACRPGEWIDADSRPATHPETGALRDDARSFWSAITDGADPLAGGAASRIPDHQHRRAYTDRGTPRAGAHITAPTPPTALDPQSVASPDHPEGWPDPAALGLPEDSDADITADLVHWIRGRSETGDGNRHAFAAPVHGRPVIVPYGIDPQGNPIEKLLIGTGDGALHLIDADTGAEEWIFHLPGLLHRQALLRDNPPGPRMPGADGTPRVLVVHHAGDGILDPDPAGDYPGDRAIAYLGLRRGGRGLYAIDITPSTRLHATGPTTAITPRLLWWIEGTDVPQDSTPWHRLGQTWSDPQPARLRMHDATGQPHIANVLIFGGGHDPAFDHGADPLQDGAFDGPAQGASIHIVDALTGTSLLTIGAGTDRNDTTIDLHTPALHYPVAAGITTLDTRNDGTIDRLYAVDIGGHVWRIDLDPNLAPSDPGNTAIARLAVLADPTRPEHRRRFFHAPVVTRVSAADSDDGHAHDLILLASGTPDRPGDTGTEDAIYALRDYQVHDPLGANDPEAAYPLCLHRDDTLAPCGAPLGESDLPPRHLPSGATTPDDPPAHAAADPPTPQGWRIPLTGEGEHSIAEPLLIDGHLYVTTWERIAGGYIDPCARGDGRLYEIDLREDRTHPETPPDAMPPDPAGEPRRTPPYRDLGPGRPTPPLILTTPDGIRILAPGAPAPDEDNPAALPEPRRTFWMEELQWDE